ncbi:DUF721 domain-containing protein [Asaia bogorensis]|uniref:DUF721 domain-containing protein n=1 Tax=Asaia bogorensis TaxID=91915 RepID=UPI001F08DB54|nr:DUF721 domain-containing protein [Asaia bogorensis]
MKRDSTTDKGLSAPGSVRPARTRAVTGKSATASSTSTTQQTVDRERRTMTGRALGAILPQVTRPAFNRKPAPAVRLILDWAEIVGPALAAQTEPRKVSAGTLTIACTGPVALELQHLAPQLIERINNHCGPLRSGRDLRFDDGTQLVRKIRILQDPGIVRPATPAARPAPRPVAITGMKEGELQEVLSRLGGHILRRPRR